MTMGSDPGETVRHISTTQWPYCPHVRPFCLLRPDLKAHPPPSVQAAPRWGPLPILLPHLESA